MTVLPFCPATSVALSAFFRAGGQFLARVIKRSFQLLLSVRILVNGWQTPVLRIRSFLDLAASSGAGFGLETTPEAHDSRGVLVQTSLQNGRGKSREVLSRDTVRGCPLGTAPLHERQQIPINPPVSRIAMARQFVYFMQGLSKTYPGNRKVLDNVHLSFYPDAKIGVLGVNGSGKSTLLRIMAGLDKEFNGEAWVAEGARVGYLEQEPQLDPGKSVRENVMEGVAKQKAILDRYNELAVNYSDETADEMTKLQDEIEAAGLWDLDSKVDQAMDALRCPPDDADVTKLSGGERRRVALCKLLLDQPDLLLLDEPTNHLDAESVSWLEGHLRNYPGAILIVTHDRYFLDNVTGWILELDRGKGIPYEGNYSSWLVQKQKRLAQEGREDVAHQRTLEREKEWIAASPKAGQGERHARS